MEKLRLELGEGAFSPTHGCQSSPYPLHSVGVFVVPNGRAVPEVAQFGMLPVEIL